MLAPNRSLRVLELEGNNLTDISVEEIIMSLRRFSCTLNPKC